MLSDSIAQRLRAGGYDVTSVVADPALVALPDDQILAHSAAEGRTLVTANIKDFIPLDRRYRTGGQSHADLILVSTKTFPQNRDFTTRVTSALAALLRDAVKIEPGHVLFLTRA
jgi:hypothetical protein